MCKGRREMGLGRRSRCRCGGGEASDDGEGVVSVFDDSSHWDLYADGRTGMA